MKKLLSLAAAFALLLGLSQCKKPNMPEYTGPIGDMIIQKATLTASNGDNGAKVDIQEPQVPNGTLDLKWEKGDKIYAYDGKGHVSVLTLVGDGGSDKGTFDGKITVDKDITTDDNITFYYYGNDVNVDNIMTAETTIDFSEQYGSLRDGETGKTIKGKLMACGTAKYDPNGKYEAELLVPFAIAKLAFNSFTEDPITVTCDKSMPTGYTISKNGELTPIGGSDKASAEMKFHDNNSSNPYFAVFVPTYDEYGKPVEKKYTFKQDDKEESIKAAFSGAYFTAGGTGGAEPVQPYFCFTAKQANSTVSMAKNGNAPVVTLEYSTNGTTWNTFTVGSTTVTLEKEGDKVYFRATTGATHTRFADGINKYNYFETTGDLSVGGNIMYLLNGTAPAETLDETNNKSCFLRLFNGCTDITDASELLLQAPTLANDCYKQMFYGCTGLTAVPATLLPATTLATNCYEQMFYGCTGLTAAPELPAKTLYIYCYRQMFQGCTGLTAAPELPAETLNTECYKQMFQGCTGLTAVPATLLPATTLAKNCYQQMFFGCTGLTAVPATLLPATTLANFCYQQMFQGCTGLTTVPELPAETLAESCYQQMFQGCTGLTTVPATLLPATTLAESCYQQMFQGCTGLTTVPATLLQATTLATYCYQQMFYGCTNLAAAPELPATTLKNYCYNKMFNGCLKLSSVTMLATTVTANKCLNEWLTNAGTSAATTPTVTVAGGMKTTIEGTLDKNVWTVYDPTPTLTVTTGDIVEMPAYGFCGCSGNASCDPQQNCEVGFVHSSSNTEPTVGGTGCTTAVSSDNKNVTPSGVSFDKQLLYTNMSAGTNYIRAYAKVNGGSEYVYGEVKTVSVTATISFPTYVRVNGGGNTRCFSTTFKSSLPQNCTYGFVYSTSQNPTVGNGTCVAETTGQLDSSGTDYTSSYIQFQKGTYYVRAYARNASGGAYTYSSDASFTIN